jgi:hypothetical protein
MNARDAIQYLLNSNQHMLKTFLSDFSDADLMVRPAPNANHVAWQLGHLIASESQLVGMAGATPTPLPLGFAEKHSKETASKDTGFLTKAEYMEVLDKVRAGTQSTLDKLSDADLGKPSTGPMAEWAPTCGSVFLLIANHTMMHAGQFTVTRRKLGKPVLF